MDHDDDQTADEQPAPRRQATPVDMNQRLRDLAALPADQRSPGARRLRDHIINRKPQENPGA
ncbi:hypothetical protein [Sphaerisporangium dianthi]|uniref:Uncharacterized protein n=1 Tax=Sphaerisporangium dianthi TaxID=1436120 RepID=A0ABV9CR71_9ACTN